MRTSSAYPNLLPALTSVHWRLNHNPAFVFELSSWLIFFAVEHTVDGGHFFSHKQCGE